MRGRGEPHCVSHHCINRLNTVTDFRYQPELAFYVFPGHAPALQPAPSVLAARRSGPVSTHTISLIPSPPSLCPPKTSLDAFQSVHWPPRPCYQPPAYTQLASAPIRSVSISLVMSHWYRVGCRLSVRPCLPSPKSDTVVDAHVQLSMQCHQRLMHVSRREGGK